MHVAFCETNVNYRKVIEKVRIAPSKKEEALGSSQLTSFCMPKVSESIFKIRMWP